MNEQKLKALAAELAKGSKTEANLNQFPRCTKLTMETVLNTELMEHLGYRENARKTAPNTHNG